MNKPQTVEQLTQWIESKFHCMVGPPTHSFVIPFVYVDKITAAKFTYHTICFLYQKAEAERKLVEHAVFVFENILSALSAARLNDPPLLFWRRKPEYMFHPAVEATPTRGGDKERSKLYMRLVIPGADVSHFETKEGEMPQVLA